MTNKEKALELLGEDIKILPMTTDYRIGMK